MEIHGIPHGDKVILEISSSLFDTINHYELMIRNLSERMIIKMDIASDGNYFSSVNNKILFYFHVSKSLFLKGISIDE